ncbi:hypothetical protein LCGC14_3166000, partial [marine sediment metagenome]
MSTVKEPRLFPVEKIRKDFPILERKVNGNPLVYLDNAATSQTPQQVIDVIVDYYTRYNANIHRGVHALSQEATDAYEQARIKIQRHFNAENPYEIIFTSGTTHGINMVASGFADLIEKGDVILVSAMEHHSNIVPWQMLAERVKRPANLRMHLEKSIPIGAGLGGVVVGVGVGEVEGGYEGGGGGGEDQSGDVFIRRWSQNRWERGELKGLWEEGGYRESSNVKPDREGDRLELGAF